MFADNRAIKLGTLAVTCVGFFMVLLDASIVTVALPTIQTQLQARLSDLQWVVDAYTLPFAALLLTAGALGDRFGRKRIFLAGLVIFTLGSAMCGAAPTLAWLIAGRVAQGIGGAALSPGSLSVLAAAFTSPRERTQAIGIWSAVSGVALAAGPLLGGALIQLSTWNAIFYVNLPIGALAFVLGLFVLRESRNPTAKRIDAPGQLLAIAALTTLTFGLIEGQTDGWTSPLILSLFGMAVVLTLTFIFVEARSAEPMLPLGLFKNSIFSTANFAAMTVGFALLGTVFFVSQFFQEVQGYTALQSGERTLPNTVGIFIMAPLAGRITARFGPRLPVALGTLLSGVALLLLTRITSTTPYSDIWWNLAMLGIGFGLTLSPLTAAVLAATPTTRAGLASSVVSASRQIGSVLGIAILGAVVQHQEATNLAGRLTTLRVPAHLSDAIANVIATAGAAAARLHLSSALPFPRSALRGLIGQSFTDALHPSFVISAVALLITAALAALLLGRGGSITTVETSDDAPLRSPEQPATRPVAVEPL